MDTLRKKHNISSQDIFANFHLLLEGQAQEWYWLYTEEHPDDSLVDFQAFRQAIVEHFRKADCDEEIRQAMNERKQDYGEKFEEYYAAVRGMELTMRTRLPEQSLVNLMRRNLKPRMKNLIFGCRIESLEDLRRECRRAEKHLAEYEAKPYRRKALEELEDEGGEEEPGTLEAFHRPARDRPIHREPSGSVSGKREDQPQGRSETHSCDGRLHSMICYKCNQPSRQLCEGCQAKNRESDGKSGEPCQRRGTPEK